ncbi:MAG: hypothetical protein Q7T54_00150 [Candidatus Levybacteria bacterium]|nr:hypothetical protein [Candidatus Levybacteria bacterium]
MKKRLTKYTKFWKAYQKKELAPIYLMIFFFIASSTIFLKGAVFNPELNYFLHNYLDDRPFLVKIFDSERHRDGAYQGREFSYVIDYLDNHFLLAFFKSGIIIFYSVSHYALVTAIVIFTYILSKRYFGNKSKLNYILLSLLYLTSPPIFLGGGAFRSSKILVSFFIAFLIFLLFKYTVENQTKTKISILIGFSIFFMATSDLQGGFYALVFAAIALLNFLIFRSLKNFKLLTSIVVANIFYIIYFNYIGKFLINFFSGKPVWNLTYNSLLTSWWIDATYFIKSALSYVVYQFSYFWGNTTLPAGFLIIVITLLIYFAALNPYTLFKANKNSKENKIKFLSFSVLLLILSSFVLLITMLHYSAMFIQPYMRLTYYNLPTITLLFIFFTYTIITFLNKWPRLNETFHIIAVVAIVFNVYHLPSFFNTIKQSPYLIDYTKSTPQLRDCIRDRSAAITSFSLPGHSYYTCDFLRAKLSGKKFKLDSQQRVIMME